MNWMLFLIFWQLSAAGLLSWRFEDVQSGGGRPSAVNQAVLAVGIFCAGVALKLCGAPFGAPGLWLLALGIAAAAWILHWVLAGEPWPQWIVLAAIGIVLIALGLHFRTMLVAIHPFPHLIYDPLLYLPMMALVVSCALGALCLSCAFRGLLAGRTGALNQIVVLMLCMALQAAISTAVFAYGMTRCPLGPGFFMDSMFQAGTLLFILRTVLGWALPMLYCLLFLLDRKTGKQAPPWHYFAPILILSTLGMAISAALTAGRGLAL